MNGLLSCLFIAALAVLAAPEVKAQTVWADIAVLDRGKIADDDLNRHASEPGYLDGLGLSETRFSENGFDWHLLRIVNLAKPVGPLWAIPHDDENAAFDAAIKALRQYGGTLVAVNSGPGSSRMQSGTGSCGDRSAIRANCDPNRNFSARTPLYTAAYLEQLQPGQPIIALHTNNPGYGRGQGDITILDIAAAAKGTLRPRKDGHFGANQPALLNNPDSYAIMPYLPPKPNAGDISCRQSLVLQGLHVWHERVGISDGSLSNYAVLNRPEIRYVNMESRRENNLAVASNRLEMMVAAYMQRCLLSGNQPASTPAR